MRKYNISANLVRTIEQLYDKATSSDEWQHTRHGPFEINAKETG